MKGGLAGEWQRRFVLKNMLTGTLPPTVTLATFNQELEKDFLEPDFERKAMLKLSRLQQGRRTADEYTSEFRTLAAEAGVTQDNALIDFYRRGLNSPIVDRIYLVTPLPIAVDVWMTLAGQIDQQFRERQAQKFGRDLAPIPASTTTTPRRAERDPDAMDVDRRHQRVALVKLTPEEREKCRQEGRCFACRNRGHSARECPNRNGTIRSPSNALAQQTRSVTVEETSSRSSSPVLSTAPANTSTVRMEDTTDTIQATREQLRALMAGLSIEDKNAVVDGLESDF
jgi:hypothetical protein